MLHEAFEKLLQACCTPAHVRAIEAGGDVRPHWEAVEASGFLDLMVEESLGGAGLSLHEAFPFVVSLGRHACALPIAQTILVRALAGAIPMEGSATFAPALNRHPDGSIRAPHVPFGLIARHVLGWDGEQLLLLDAAQATRTPTGVHASLQASLAWSDPLALSMPACSEESFQALGAALYAALIAGAMQRAFELTLAYCNERMQFGRPIGKFQAVQHQLSVMAEQVVASSMAAEAAFASGSCLPVLLAAAAAKLRASDAVIVVANAAHALHGAIGITEEYDLQLMTRRLHEWRVAHGSESYWSLVLGEALMASDTRMTDFIRSY